MRILMLLAVIPLTALAAEPNIDKLKSGVTDPAEAGPDFAIQGEYEGELVMEGEKLKVGAQVIAEGDGKFRARLLKGGLPGAGWDGQRQATATGKIEDGQVPLKGEFLSGTITGEKFTVQTSGDFGKGSGTLTKVLRKSPTLGTAPPEGAVVLFDGKTNEGWVKADGKTPSPWKVENGVMEVVRGGGTALTKFETDKPFTLHLEFKLPFMPFARGQGRANSGVYLGNRYECQILDSFALKGVNNECGGFYTLKDPAVNMCLPPLSWQTYDIDFTPAVFEGDKKVKNAVVTVRHNGVVIHENYELPKETPGGKKESAAAAPLHLQDHGNPVQFRNIWLLEKK